MTTALNITELSPNDGWQSAAGKINYNFRNLYAALRNNVSDSSFEAEQRLSKAITDLSDKVDRELVDIDDDLSDMKADIRFNADGIDDLKERIDNLDLPDAFDPTEINNKLDGIDSSISGINSTLSSHTAEISGISDGLQTVESDIEKTNKRIDDLVIPDAFDPTEIMNELKAINDKIDNMDIPDPVPHVGTILIYSDDTDPNEIYPGTEWQRIEDRFLLATGKDNALGDVGGEKTHVLSTAEMPKHAHSMNYRVAGFPSPWGLANNGGAAGYTATVNRGDAPNYIVALNNTGGGEAHNNMPPFLAVNMWKRVN